MAAKRIRQMGKFFNRFLRLDAKGTNSRPRRKSNHLRGIETVEHRRMLAGTELVFDVNVVPDSIRYEEGIELDGAFYFWATSTEHSRTGGHYLWKYDPQANGGQGEAEPLSLDVVNFIERGEQNMIAFDGKVYFEGLGGLAYYDPVTDSFTHAADVRVTGTSTYPTRFEVLNDKLYILGFDDSFDRILIEYEPQAGGGPGTATTIGEFGSGGFQWMKALGNRLYFSYGNLDRDQHIGEQIWYYDPDANSGQGELGQIIDFDNEFDYGPVGHAIVWNDKLYFSAHNNTNRELYAYDPAANNGQGELITVSDFESMDRAYPRTGYAVLEDKLYFSAYTYATGTELWRYDPADGSVEIVEDFFPNSYSSDPQFLTVVAGNLYYYGSYAINERGLIRFDPTANDGQGELEVVDVLGGFNPFFAGLVNFDDKLVFDHDRDYEDSPNIAGPALYDPEANGGAGETIFLPFVLNDTQSANPRSMLELNGKYYFQAYETFSRSYLWEYDPAAPVGVDPIRKITGDIVIGVEEELYLFEDKIYFAGYSVEHGVEVWEFDPSANSGEGELNLIADVDPGLPRSFPANFTSLDGKLYFTAYGDAGEELYVYDPDASGGEGEFRLAADIHPNGSSGPADLTPYNGKLYMSAWDGESGTEVWVYDPAANGGMGGASMLVDLIPGWDGGDPRGFTEFNGKLYFAAEDDDEAFELWEYNPAATGGIEPLRRLVNLKDGTYPIPQPGMLEFEGRLYFNAYNDAFGEELWVYDPATDSVSMVADVAPGELDFSPIKKIAFDGKLYMIGSGPSGDNQLWAYDPAAFEGLGSLTKVDLNYNEGSLSDLVDLWLFDGKIYLDAFDINYGHELFVYDPNQVPNAVDDTYTAQEDTPLTIDVAAGILSNDSDVGDGPLIVRVTTNASHGTLVVNDDGSFTYTADANYHGVDSFVYEVEDRDGEVTSGTVQLTIESVADPAVITGDTAGTTDEDSTTPVTGTLTVFDTDPGESSFIAQINTVGTYGTFWINSVGNWDYTVDTSLTQSLSGLDVASDTFTVESIDGTQQDVTIQINGLNDVPVFGSTPTGSVEEDGTLTASGMATVTDPDAGESFFQVYSSTTPYGTYSIEASGDWTYTLDNAKAQKLLGGETITDWVVMVPLDGSTSLDVPITITGQNDVAVIGGQLNGSVQEDITLSVSGTATITDPDQGQSAFTAQSNISGAYGTFSIDTLGNWTYQLDDSAAQKLAKRQSIREYFRFDWVDGSGSDYVIITVEGTNDAAVITGDTFGQTNEDTTADVTGMLSVTDADQGESLFVEQSDTAGYYGTFSLDANGNWTYVLDTVLAQELHGDTFFLEIFYAVAIDGTVQSLTIEIEGLDDAAMLGGDQTGNVSEDGVLSVSGTATIDDPDFGEAIFNYGSGETHYGTYSNDDVGNWTYTLDNDNYPVQNLAGGQMVTDTFTMVSIDGSASLVITITITGENDEATIAGGLVAGVVEDTKLSASDVVWIMDTDDGQAAFQVQSGSTTYGSYTIDASGNWTYHLDNASVQYLRGGQLSNDAFTVYSLDGSASQQVVLQIMGTNDPPVIGGDVDGMTNEDVTAEVRGTLTITDVDTHQNFFTPQLDTAGTAGTFSLDALGDWKYQLDNALVQNLPVGLILQETFTVVSRDGTEQVVTIDIHGLNDLPIPTIVSVEGYPFAGNPIDVAGMVEDVDTDTSAIVFDYYVYYEDDINPLIISSEDLNHFSFTPQLTGEYRIVLSVMDDQGGAATTEQTITIGEASNVDFQLLRGSTAQVGDTDGGSPDTGQMLHEWEDATGQLWLTIDADLPPGPLNMSFEFLYSGQLLLAPQVVDQLGTASLESEVVDQGIASTLTLTGVDLASYEIGDRVLLANVVYPKDVDNVAGLAMDQTGAYPQPLSEHGVQLVSAELVEAGQVLRPQANVPGQIAPVVYDANDDGRVGLADFARFISSYGRQPGTDQPQAFRFDYDRDGRVGLSDFALFIKHYGKRKSQTNVSIDIPAAVTNPPAAATFKLEEEPAPAADQPDIQEMPGKHEMIVLQAFDYEIDPDAVGGSEQDSTAEVILGGEPFPIEHEQLDARLLDAALGELTQVEETSGEQPPTDEELLFDWTL